MSINGHKTSCARTMYLRKKEKKRYIISSLHPSKEKDNTPSNKMIPKTNSTPKSDYSHIQNYSLFLSRVIKGRVSSRYLIGRASISIILSIRIGSNWMTWRRSRRMCKAAHCRLPSCNKTYRNVHLIQLRRECIQASIHVLQLCHDVS